MAWSGGQGLVADVSIIARFGLGGRDVADRREAATVVVPDDPLQGGALDGLEGAPRPAPRWITSASNKPLIVSAKALS